MRFEPGRVILHRHFHGDRIGLLKTSIVVRDDDQGLLLWVPRGAPMLDRKAVDGRGLRAMPFDEWTVTDTKLWEVNWGGPAILKLLPPGADHSVWWFWDERGAFKVWYVNLEEAGVRWDDGVVAGVDIVDQDLDIVVAPDRSWRWKDEEEFVERLAYPAHYWVRDEAAVREEGERVVKLIEAGVFPFDGSWCDFRPDPAWSTPAVVPAGWDRPRVVATDLRQ
jgi:predicted RNA-binding protein associated with RNAse of E/G family